MHPRYGSIHHVHYSCGWRLRPPTPTPNVRIPVLPVLPSLRLDIDGLSLFHFETFPRMTSFPSFNHLSIENFDMYHRQINAFDLAVWIAEQMPSLTHLKIPVELIHNLKLPKGLRQDCVIITNILSTVEHVFISGDVDRFVAYGRYGMVDVYMAALVRCRELACEDDSVVLDPDDSGMVEFYSLRHRYQDI